LLIGIGIDLVELSRVAGMLERWGDRLVERIMDPEEVARLPPSPEARTRAVAEAIALKESASKALGTGWSQGIFWRNVTADLGPPPRITLTGPAAVLASKLGASDSHAEIETRGDLVIGEVWLLR
jgi:holo-[acyl-carrier protein] synthase